MKQWLSKVTRIMLAVLLAAGMMQAPVVKVNALDGTTGSAYAVKTADKELIFFRSTETYATGDEGTFTDINGTEYTGTVTAGIENSTVKFTGSDIVSVRVASGQRVKPRSLSNYFASCLDLVTADLRGFDWTGGASAAYLFKACSSLVSADLSGANSSGLIFTNEMFDGCTALESVDLTGFSTASVKYAGSMFRGCSNLTALDVSGFETGEMTSMNEMFSGCSSINFLDTCTFDTSSVEDMSSMFKNCENMTNVDVSVFDTSSVTKMSSMFEGCKALNKLDVSKFNTSSVKTMARMFYGCESLTTLNLSSFDTSSVTSMSNMFTNCSSLISLDLSSFNTESVTSLLSLFAGCTKLVSLNLQNLTVNEGTSMGTMFVACDALKSVTLGTGIKKWDASAYLPEATWTNGTLEMTAADLCSQYPANRNEWAGEWHVKEAPHYKVYLNGLDEGYFTSRVMAGDYLLDLKYDAEGRSYYMVPAGSSADFELTISEGIEVSGDISVSANGNPVPLTHSGDGVVAFTWTPTEDTIIVVSGIEPEKFVIARSASLALEGKILVQFKIVVPDPDQVVATAVITRDNGRLETITVPAVRDTSVQDQYLYRIPMAAKEMGDNINLSFKDLEGNPVRMVTGSGVEKPDGIDYSVNRYLNNKASDSNEKVRNLCRAMKAFGQYSQYLFNYRTDLIVNLEELNEVDLEVLSAYQSQKTGTVPAGVTVTAASMVLESDTTINFKLAFDDEQTVSQYTYTLNGTAVTPVKENGVWMISKTNIVAKELDVMQELTITDGTDTVTYRYGALTYCYNNLRKATTSDTLKNACRAIYWYNQAAHAYFD